MNTDRTMSLLDKPNSSTKLKHACVTDAILGCFYDVYNELGPGFLESVYRNALGIALQSKGLRVTAEKAVEVRFRGHSVGLFRADFVVEEVIIELKCARS